MRTPMDALTQGVYLVGVSADGICNFMIAAWVTQISSKAILVAIGKSHYTAELIEKAKHFSLSVLKTDQCDLAKQCGTVSGRKADKVSGLAIVNSPDGDPMLQDAAAHFACHVLRMDTVLDHVLICGEVVDARLLGGTPLQYHSWEFFG